MHPTDIIGDRSNYLKNFVPVPTTHAEFIYIGMFLTYIDDNLHRGGFVYKISDDNLEITLSSTNDHVDVSQMVIINLTQGIHQLYKKIDFCFFEIYELEHKRIASLCSYIASLEERIKMLERK